MGSIPTPGTNLASRIAPEADYCQGLRTGEMTRKNGDARRTLPFGLGPTMPRCLVGRGRTPVPSIMRQSESL